MSYHLKVKNAGISGGVTHKIILLHAYKKVGFTHPKIFESISKKSLFSKQTQK